jgi:sigma-B regulation protein RsbU (phosphoserine phosphatase)
LLCRPGGEVTVLGRPGTLLGVFPATGLSDAEAVLQPGEALLLYTDGVTEGRRGPEFFGDGRLRAAIGQLPRAAAALAHDIRDAVLHFQAGDPRDDIAIQAVAIPSHASSAETGDDQQR